MRRKLILGALALMASGSSIIGAPAFADSYGGDHGYYDNDGRITKATGSIRASAAITARNAAAAMVWSARSVAASAGP